ATTGYLVSTDTTHVLVDCGAGVLANLLQVLPPHRLDALILTHAHPDHVSDLVVLPHLVEFVAWRRLPEPRPLPVYAAPATAADLGRLLDEACLERRPLSAAEAEGIGDLTVRCARVEHAVETWAVRLEHGASAFVFSADTGPTSALTRLAGGADLFVCEATLPDELVERARAIGHLTPSLAGRAAAEAGVRRLLLTHIAMGFDPDRFAAAAAAAGPVPAAAAEPLRTYPV
ncbi:MAG TPA: MBL fold metallo-hydrolase, partial [Bacillota bacterium]